MADTQVTPGAFYPAQLFRDELAFPAVVPLGSRTQKLALKQKKIRLHSALPETPILAYTARQGSRELVNPTLQARSGVPVAIEYVNQVAEGSLPIGVVRVAYNNDDNTAIPQNAPGSVAATPGREVIVGVPAADGTAIPVSTVPSAFSTHLHGANSEANSDGWPENLMLPGQSHRFHYSMQEPAAMLWYHDHALHATRLNVYSGLAGLWMVRDDDDDRIVKKLKLQGSGDDRPEFELPLLIQDCNLELNASGEFTGQLLHKTELADGVPEFFGPYTMVNRTIWPKCTVKRRQYRLRLLNGCNARTLQLALVDDAGNRISWSSIAVQIGSDGGLRASPVPAGEDLVIAPAERLDLIVDFAAAAVQTLTVLNRAAAPFGGDAIALPAVGGPPTEEALNGRVPMAEVMRFDLYGPASAPKPIPALSSSFRRIVHEKADADPGERVVAIPDLAGVQGGHFHRLIALTEELLDPADTATTLTLRELMPFDAARNPSATDRLIALTEPDPATPGNPLKTTLYRTAAKLFHDGPTIVGAPGEIDVWRVVNLTGDTHPFHVHLSDVQVLGRQTLGDLPADVDWADFDPQKPAANPVPVAIAADIPPLDTDRCWKDVVRINPGEAVKIAVPYGAIDPETDTITTNGFAGRYMYHCHILEHEDHDMMRPFLVLPKVTRDLMPPHKM